MKRYWTRIRNWRRKTFGRQCDTLRGKPLNNHDRWFRDAPPPISCGHEYFTDHRSGLDGGGLGHRSGVHTPLRRQLGRGHSVVRCREGPCRLHARFGLFRPPGLNGTCRPSLVTVRISNTAPEIVASRLLDVLPVVADDLEQGSVVTIEEETVRIRTLPIGG